jgi:hypothetical protein
MLDATVVRDQVCSFLDQEEIIELLGEENLSEYFQLGQYFCSLHGTKLKEVDEEERESFFSEPEHDELPSAHPGCIDCSMSREGQKRCEKCEDFEPWDYFLNCDKCELQACENCFEGVYQCEMCNQGQYCRDCFDGYYCEGCDREFCHSCRPGVKCGVCADCMCGACVDLDVMIRCGKCGGTACESCWGGQLCDFCSSTSCQDCSDDGNFCEICERWCCQDCTLRLDFECGQCKKSFCGDCYKSRGCEICDKRFCEACVTSNEGKFCCDDRCNWFCGDCKEYVCHVVD